MVLVFFEQIKWTFPPQLLWVNTMVITPSIHYSMVWIFCVTFIHMTYICMWPYFTGTAYTFSKFTFVIHFSLNYHYLSITFVVSIPICMRSTIIILSQCWDQVYLYQAIMPTISPCGLHGNHFLVWTPPANTKAYLQNNKYSLQNPSFSPPFTSRANE